jgi:ribosomal protein L37AE/L43A
MSEDIVCPNSGRDDHLGGQRLGDVIRITCSACELVWDRDPSPRCPTCGRSEVRPVPQAVWERSRGTQLSAVALQTLYLCPQCDAETLSRHLDSGSPVPPKENPAADLR